MTYEKTLKILLSLGLALCMLVSVCACTANEIIADTDTDTDTESDTTGGNGEKGGEETVYEDKIVKENYLPADVRSYYEDVMSKGDGGGAVKYCVVSGTTDHSHHAFQDVATISNCVINKISIAVYNTKNTDANGDFVFSLFVHKNSLVGLKSTPVRQYKIKINAAEHGLEANKTKVLKFIDVDLTQYGIMLMEDETLAMYDSTDTIVPARMLVSHPTNYATERSEIALKICEEFPQAQSFYAGVGSSAMTYQASMFLFYDFEWERIYTAEEQKAAAELQKEYEELVALLKEKYQGKTVSIIGDSISTFDKISNNTDYNSTIGENLKYHNHTGNPHKWENTYWGKLVNDLDMTLCVNNAWASGRVYGRYNGKTTSKNDNNNVMNFSDSLPNRATQLHRNDGTTPDLIIVYMGINDLTNNAIFGQTPFGGLYDLLKNASADNYSSIINAWFGNVLAKTSNGATLLDANKKPTYADFEEAYALALYLMMQKYPNAEVMCFGLEDNANTVFSDAKRDKFDLVIKALADHFGATFVDQQGAYSEITAANMHYHTMDTICTHLNYKGHAATERMILRYLADKVKNG